MAPLFTASGFLMVSQGSSSFKMNSDCMKENRVRIQLHMVLEDRPSGIRLVLFIYIIGTVWTAARQSTPSQV